MLFLPALDEVFLSMAEGIPTHHFSMRAGPRSISALRRAHGSHGTEFACDPLGALWQESLQRAIDQELVVLKFACACEEAGKGAQALIGDMCSLVGCLLLACLLAGWLDCLLAAICWLISCLVVVFVSSSASGLSGRQQAHGRPRCAQGDRRPAAKHPRISAGWV